MNNVSTWFKPLDSLRRVQGAMLDAAGLGPRETDFSVVHRERGLALRDYGGEASGPQVLIVPAPIKRPYIWDLAPEVSAVRRCLDAGLRVFMADWQSAPPRFGLAEFAERLVLRSLEATGSGPAFLLGHSLGGLFAAIFAALHPQRVRGLVLLAAPLNFGAAAPAFLRMADALDADELPDSLPGSALAMASFNAAPGAFGWERWADGALSFADPQKLRAHLQVERWALDEFALPRALVADLVGPVIRENRFARGELQIGARGADPRAISAPLLCVIDPQCEIVSPQTVLPVLEGLDKTLLEYERDTGVALQHVGPLVSQRAHASLWPRITRWMKARA